MSIGGPTTVQIKVLCFDLTNLRKWFQFVVLACAVFAFHCVQGYMHELIFSLKAFKPYSLYMTLVQFLIYAVLAAFETLLTKGFRLRSLSQRRVKLKTYFFIAFLTVATLGLSNIAVPYLNFPTFNMFKSCKLIPVMIGSILIMGKRYKAIDYLACLCMCFGLIFFTMADSQVQPSFELYGVIMVSSALVADAVIGNTQEKAMKEHNSSNTEMVLYSYSIGFVYILVWELLVSQRFFEAYEFCSQHPHETYGYIFIFSIFGYIGLNVVLTLVKNFGALIAVTVTTCRKAFTIVLSFILFEKPFTFQYFWSGLLVLIGIYLNIYSSNQAAWNKYFLQRVKYVQVISSRAAKKKFSIVKYDV